jgi:hypothetical protein
VNRGESPATSAPRPPLSAPEYPCDAGMAAKARAARMSPTSRMMRFTPWSATRLGGFRSISIASRGSSCSMRAIADALKVNTQIGSPTASFALATLPAHSTCEIERGGGVRLGPGREKAPNQGSGIFAGSRMISCTDEGTTPLAGMPMASRCTSGSFAARRRPKDDGALPCQSARRPSGRAESARRPRWRGWRDTRCKSSSRRRGNHSGRSRRPRRLRDGRTQERPHAC